MSCIGPEIVAVKVFSGFGTPMVGASVSFSPSRFSISICKIFAFKRAISCSIVRGTDTPAFITEVVDNISVSPGSSCMELITQV